MISHLFCADNLQIYLHNTKDKFWKGLSRLEEVVQLVTGWSGSSSLRFNPEKTKAIFFDTRKNVNNIYSCNLLGVGVQDEVTGPFSDLVIRLGITLHSKFTWKPQIDPIIKKSINPFIACGLLEILRPMLFAKV